MSEDTKPEDEWDDSLNDLIFGTANYKPPEERMVEESFDTDTPMGVYQAILHKQIVSLTFPNKEAAKIFRDRLAQIKIRKDKMTLDLGMFSRSDLESLLFRRDLSGPDYTVDISIGTRKSKSKDYGFTVNSVKKA